MPSRWVLIRMSWLGSLFARGRSKTELATVKIAVFAPIPSASVTTVRRVNPGAFANIRMLCLKIMAFLLIVAMILLPAADHCYEAAFCGGKFVTASVVVG